MKQPKENQFLAHNLPNLLSMREQYAHVLNSLRKERNLVIPPMLLHVAESSAAVAVATMVKDQYIDVMVDKIENGTIPEKFFTGVIGVGTSALALHLLLQHTRDAKSMAQKNITIRALKESLKAIDEAIEIKKAEKGEE